MNLEINFLTDKQKDNLQETYLRRVLNSYLIKDDLIRRDVQESAVDKLSALRHDSMYCVLKDIHDGLVKIMNENSADYETCSKLNIVRHDMQKLMDLWVKGKQIIRIDKETGEQVKL